jgi:hypothetical protein
VAKLLQIVITVPAAFSFGLTVRVTASFADALIVIWVRVCRSITMSLTLTAIAKTTLVSLMPVSGS